MSFLLLMYLAALPQKEVLTYDVWLGPLYAGEMKLSFIETYFDGIPCWRFRSVLRTTNGAALLFSLNDTIYSYVSRDDFRTLYFEKRMHETNYDTVIKVRYDWGNNLIRYEDGSTYSLEQGTLDIVSIYYYLRLYPLSVGDEREIILHVDRKTDKSLVKAVSETAVRSQASSGGSYWCTKLVPEVKGKGSFGTGGNMIFYMTADEQRIPALIRTMMNLGAITARLKSVWKE